MLRRGPVHNVAENVNARLPITPPLSRLICRHRPADGHGTEPLRFCVRGNSAASTSDLEWAFDQCDEDSVGGPDAQSR